MNNNQKEAEFLDLINKHQNIIHKICFVYSYNKTERQDLSQEIILQVWKSFSSFKGQSAFSTWLYRVALNTAIGYLKKVEKAIILLWLEEKSYQEIAETIGITVKNVSVKLVRIKSRLAEIIKKLQ